MTLIFMLRKMIFVMPFHEIFSTTKSYDRKWNGYRRTKLSGKGGTSLHQRIMSECVIVLILSFEEPFRIKIVVQTVLVILSCVWKKICMKMFLRRRAYQNHLSYIMLCQRSRYLGILQMKDFRSLVFVFDRARTRRTWTRSVPCALL